MQKPFVASPQPGITPSVASDKLNRAQMNLLRHARRFPADKQILHGDHTYQANLELTNGPEVSRSRAAAGSQS